MKDGLVYGRTLERFGGLLAIHTTVRYGYFFKDDKDALVDIPYLYHREDGPARTTITSDGIIVNEQWFIDGMRHRINGPAFISYDSKGSGDIQSCDYHILDYRVLEEDYYTPGFIDSFILEHS